jgi:hypothetical protein
MYLLAMQMKPESERNELDKTEKPCPEQQPQMDVE